MHPDTIPKEFFGFMNKTSRVTPEMLAFNRATVRGFPLDLKMLREMINKYKPTARTLEIVSAIPENVPVLSCAVFHPSKDSCTVNSMERLIDVTKTIFPVYATLNFVPLLVLRTKRLLKEYVSHMALSADS